MKTAVSDFISKIIIEEPQQHQNMVVFPVRLTREGEVKYITLSEAIRKNLIEITEVSESGRVPELVVVSHSDYPILIVDGEELVGAKQNRIVNVTIMLKPRSKTIIPVSCTEQGRWSWRSRHFQDSDIIMPYELRKMKTESVWESREREGTHRAAQFMIWDSIQAYERKSQRYSRTHAMHDIYESSRETLESFKKHFRAVDCQCGMLVFINNKRIGIDILSRSQAFTDLYPKFLNSYVFDAILNAENGSSASNPTIGDAEAIIKAIGQIEGRFSETVGIGKDYRIEHEHLRVNALIVEGEVIHLNGYDYHAQKEEPRKPREENREEGPYGR